MFVISIHAYAYEKSETYGGDFDGGALWMYLVAGFCNDIRDKVSLIVNHFDMVLTCFQLPSNY